MSPSIARRLAVASTLLAALLAPGAASAAATTAPAAAATTKSGPPIATFTAAFAYGLTHPDLDPSGANDFTCTPSAAHPRPVVLLHGTYSNRFNSFAAMAPALKAQGYCVFAPDYGKGHLKGINGTQAVRFESREIAAYVDRVLAATGAAQVDVVGYSQGGLVARAYLEYDGGANPADPSKNKVASLTGLSVDNRGATIFGLRAFVERYRLRPLLRLLGGNSSVDQLAGSGFLKELNAGGDTVPGVKYAMLATATDEINTPARHALLAAGPGATVTNTFLQTGCLTDLSDHFNITYSRRAIWLVLKALDPGYAAPEPCQVLLPTL